MNTKSNVHAGPVSDVPSLRERLRATDPAVRVARALAALDRIEQITDKTDTDEVWADVFRGIDEARPHRPLFRGMY